MIKWLYYLTIIFTFGIKNLPLTDDWRRHIDARRKALQRRRTKRRGVADGGNNFGASGDRFYNGAAQTDGNFEEVLNI
jgi:hypothetical protein